MGWGHEEILGLELETVETYWSAITMIEAQQTLLQLKIADYPNMKKSDRQKFHRYLHKLAYPKTHEAPITMEQLGARLRSNG